ncbi:MAG: GWxTD domain-containing protein [Ignavibacteriae bacterium]|nr:GWxTD domain-containing protein [Ignavibacteriota bacterium]
MKVRVRLSIAGLLSFCVFIVASAQVEVAERAKKENPPPYDVDIISFAAVSSPQSRLDVFIQIGFDQLSFVKRDDKYHASYELTISVLDEDKSLVSEKLWTEEVTATDFDESVSSDAYSLTQRVFEVPPGTYYIITSLRDNETKVSHQVAKQLKVADYSGAGLFLSDIMLVSRISARGDKKIIAPLVSGNVGNVLGQFYVFFEAYSDKQLDSVSVVATVLNKQKERMLKIDTVEVLASGRTQLFVGIDHSMLALGEYTVYAQVFPLRAGETEEQKPLANTSRAFVVHWLGIPKGIRDLDLAIDQLQYIAKDKELEVIRNARTAEEKQKQFLEFWKRRDPNPNTPRNEKMEEYYAKVEYANKHFKHYIDGWKTDMGMIYIIFGSPSNVDRHPFDSDSKPYEVWSYYDLNQQFVFVDETGFGDYRLTTPVWDVWQRPRY